MNSKCLCVVLLFLAGCGVDQIGNQAAVLSNDRVAFPVNTSRIGDVFYVTAEALRCDKATHKMYIYGEAPTFLKPANTANIGVRRNGIGFDVDLTANTDMFIPIDKPENSSEYIVSSITLPPKEKEEAK